MRVVAIDPGQHVGIAFRNHDGSHDAVMIHQEMKKAWDLVWAAKPDVFVIERFATAGKISRAGLDTVECQGSFYLMAHLLNARLYFHTPQTRNARMKEARAELGLSSSKIDSHQIDALAHLLVWEFMHKGELNG